MGEGKTNMFGKTYNTIGSTDSNFIIKTKGDLKVQWGGKFIDIIKNGKIASPNTNILKTISNSDNIVDNGIYVVPNEEGNEVWVSVDGTKINLSENVGTTYISFLSEQPNITADQKYIALTNAGFYYETLEEAQQAGIKAGIIFIVDENKLYLAKEGKLSEYTALSEEDKNTYFDELTIQNLKICEESNSMTISSPQIQFKINNQLAVILDTQLKSHLSLAMQHGTFIQSSNASPTTGYRLYVKNNKSILEVDSIIWRDMDQSLKGVSNTINDTIIYSSCSNIIKEAIAVENNIICTLKYLNKFPTQGKVYFSIPINIQLYTDYEQEDTNITITASIGSNIASQDIEIEIEYTADEVSNTLSLIIPKGSSEVSNTLSDITNFSIDNTNIISGPSNITNSDIQSTGQLIECDIVDSNAQDLTISIDAAISDVFLDNCKDLFIYLSNSPLITITKNNIDLLDRSKNKPDTLEETIDNTIHTRIGIVKEEDFNSLKECPEQPEDVKVGIYSDNFIGINSKLYDTIFKKRCDFPKYDSSIELPEDYSNQKYNTVMPTIGWIKQLLQLVTPRGAIIMFNGNTEIPEGWAICDGNNGTPNLVGKFIKAVASIDEVGDNESILNKDNELVLSQDYLPKHSHPHKAHTHSLKEDSSSSTRNSSVSLKDSNHNTELTSKTHVTSVTEDDNNTKTNSDISNMETQKDTPISRSSINFKSSDTEGDTALSSTISEEQTLSDSEWPNKPLKIEPRSYSLVFIMKL